MKTGRAEELLNALRLVAAGGTAFATRGTRAGRRVSPR